MLVYIGLVRSSSVLFFINCMSYIYTEDEREFEYDEHSEKGPSRWGDIKKEWADCKNGKMQSPIDLSHERVKVFRKLEKKSYRPANATVKNRGHDISVRKNQQTIIDGFNQLRDRKIYGVVVD